jgi:hypothetical protein
VRAVTERTRESKAKHFVMGAIVMSEGRRRLLLILLKGSTGDDFIVVQLTSGTNIRLSDSIWAFLKLH